MSKPLLIIQCEQLSQSMPSVTARFADFDQIITEALGLTHLSTLAIQIHAGEPLPEPSHISGALITGAAAMVSEQRPWMQVLSEWLRKTLSMQVPLLGICFGHQILAHTLGAKVGTNTAHEWGQVHLQRSPVAATDPLFSVLPESCTFSALHHEWSLSAPPNTQIILSNAHGIEALRYGPYAWGVQFHPECKPMLAQAIIEAIRPDLEADQVDVEQALASITCTDHGPLLMRRFGEIVESRDRDLMR